MKIRTHDVDVFDLIVLSRYKNWHTNNTRHNNWDSSGIFYTLNVGFCVLESRSKTTTTTLGGKEHIFFVRKWVQHGVSQSIVTRIVGKH